MAKIECSIYEDMIEHQGKLVPGVVVTCGSCDFCAEVPGIDSHETRMAVLAKLRETCKMHERNTYLIVE